MNELSRAQSPYLRQHADNPVDWQEWSDDAFARARSRDVPVLLSVGYAACHWCHVMAHESFEDEQVAAAINANYVAIKVDREERPDIDAVYMQATTALTGSGGWPMTCLLTPDGEPFWAGTYLPKPQLLRLLAMATRMWREQRADVDRSAARISEHLRAAAAPGSGSTALVDASPLEVDPLRNDLVPLLADALDRLATSYDNERGGFGGAPKFPPSMVLEFLLRHHARTGDEGALAMARHTCEAMARGGMYDQLAGGFSRYSVDADWVVPHFEKMLYDNALLVGVYTRLHRADGCELSRRVVEQSVGFLLRDLRTDEGMFAASLDADADGSEGSTYVWTPQQLIDTLGDTDGRRAADLLGVTETGTFEHGSSTLQLRHEPSDDQGHAAWWESVRERLLVARSHRPQPARDDKVVTAWNGLAICALVEAGVTFARSDWIDAARTCADALLRIHRTDDGTRQGGLRRSSLAGVVGRHHAVAEDYGALALALLALHQVDTDAQRLAQARELLTAATVFNAPDGGWFDSADGTLLSRTASRNDNAEPCGTSLLADAELTFGALTGEQTHLRRAAQAVTAMLAGSWDPRFAGRALAVAQALVTGPLEVAVVAPTDHPLARAARVSRSPGQVTVVGQAGIPGIPLLADREVNEPTAFVCRGFVCDAPVTDADALRQRLAQSS